MLRCAAASEGGTSSAAKRIKPKRPVRLLEQLLDSCLGMGELIGGAPYARDAFLEECQRLVEREVVALQLGDDGFEPREIGGEGQRGSRGSRGSKGSRGRRMAFSARAVTSPSRTRSVNPSPIGNSSTDDSV